MKVVVVGAGLVGCALTAELRRKQHDVVLLEKAVPGAEASSAAAGILGPQLENEHNDAGFALGLEGRRATVAWAERLKTDVDVDVDVTDAGAVLVAFDDDGARALHARGQWQRMHGCRADYMPAKEARARAPELTHDITGALFLDDDASLDPRLYGMALQKLARQSGAEVISGTAVAGVRVTGNTVTGVDLADGRVCEGDVVVVCAGAWSAHVPGVRDASGITSEHVFPLRGQIAVVQGTPAPHARVVFGAHSYVVPRKDGRLLCGSTMENVGFDKSTTEEGLALVRAKAKRLLPHTASLPTTASWAGLRPATRDGKPLIGETRTRGLWMSTGHQRNGVLLAAVSAEIVTEMLEGKSPAIDVAAFSPRRFLPAAHS